MGLTVGYFPLVRFLVNRPCEKAWLSRRGCGPQLRDEHCWSQPFLLWTDPARSPTFSLAERRVKRGTNFSGRLSGISPIAKSARVFWQCGSLHLGRRWEPADRWAMHWTLPFHLAGWH